MRLSDCFRRSTYLRERRRAPLLLALHQLGDVAVVPSETGVAIEDAQHMLAVRRRADCYVLVAPVHETLGLAQQILNLLGLPIVELSHLRETPRRDLRDKATRTEFHTISLICWNFL